MLTIKDLSFSYGEVDTLTKISLEAPAESIACVMGRNGVGKTTLMKCIVGLLKPSAGSIVLDGMELMPLRAYERSRAGLAFVPQGRMIFPRMTVEENLLVGIYGQNKRSKTIPGEVYEFFPVLKEMSRRMGGDLSGGQQQQLAIARALATQPKLLILDEPTEGIQPNIIQLIESILMKIVAEKKMSILIVEQYLDFACRIGDSYTILDGGKVVDQGDMKMIDREKIERHLSV
jgi:urea transport system ATP-binding protein